MDIPNKVSFIPARGQWWGRGAERLGLRGQVQEADFVAALQGRRPGSGEVLVPQARATGTHRAAWDLVFSAPKSVSVLALVGGDERLLAAHNAAVREALIELERAAMTRGHGGTERVTTGILVIAIFLHDLSRDLDPQLHSHAVMINLTQRPDGAWRALDPRPIFGLQRFATAIYRAALARELQRLGYEVYVGQDGQPEIAGVSPGTLAAFSRRRQAIEAEVARTGAQSGRGRQLAVHRTRLPKAGGVDRAALLSEWQGRASATGTDLAALREAAEQRGPIEWSAEARQARAEAAVGFAVEHVFERRAVVDARWLEQAAIAYDPLGVDLAAVRREIERRKGTGTFLSVGSGLSVPHTTPEKG